MPLRRRTAIAGTLLAGALLALPLAGALLPAAPARAAEEVNLYTTREPGLIQPLLAAFTAKTGIKVNTVFVNAGLAERVAAEGARSPADVLMTVDVGSLVDLDRKGLTQRIADPAVAAAVPAALRDPEANWVPLSLRARVILVAKDRVQATTMTYEDLADPKWKGRVCLRSGNHPYNTALIAAMIARNGPAATEAWLKGVKANLARKPAGGDREVARDILAGICDIGLSNSYYVGLMLSGAGGAEQKKWGESVRVILPSFAGGSGTHVNISGAAIARHAPRPANAAKLIGFLLSPEAQKTYAEANFEFPVLPGIALHSSIAHLGVLTVDSTRLSDIAAQRGAASMMVDRVGFDQ
jgi:iron(III) transport system substrate-binding protein